MRGLKLSSLFALVLVAVFFFTTVSPVAAVPSDTVRVWVS